MRAAGKSGPPIPLCALAPPRALFVLVPPRPFGNRWPVSGVLSGSRMDGKHPTNTSPMGRRFGMARRDEPAGSRTLLRFPLDLVGVHRSDNQVRDKAPICPNQSERGPSRAADRAAALALCELAHRHPPAIHGSRKDGPLGCPAVAAFRGFALQLGEPYPSVDPNDGPTMRRKKQRNQFAWRRAEGGGGPGKLRRTDKGTTDPDGARSGDKTSQSGGLRPVRKADPFPKRGEARASPFPEGVPTPFFDPHPLPRRGRWTFNDQAPPSPKGSLDI
jgi:hypothetical protein